MSHDTLVLGVVGGGTRTMAWLAPMEADPTRQDESGVEQPLGDGESGGADPSFLGIDATLQHLDEAISQAFEKAGIERAPVDAAVFALAGTEVEGRLSHYQEWVEQHQIARLTDVQNDASATLAAGCPDGWGVALVAATGSIAFARSPDNVTGTAGGWGWLLGDEGSGFQIALNGIGAAIHAYDGCGPQTALMGAMLKAFNVQSPAELIREVYNFPNNLRNISAKAPVVTQVAQDGDEVAKQIVRTGAKQLSLLVRSLISRPEFGWDEFPLAISGGAFRDSMMRSCVEAELQSCGLSPQIQHVPHVPAGAILMARKLAEK